MPPPIALQLYTIRQKLQKDFEGSIRKVADMGYVGVETATFPGITPKKAAQLFQDLGLIVCAAHLPLPLGDQKNEVLDTMDALDCQYLVCPHLSQDYYQSLDSTKRTCDLLNEANAAATAHGLLLGVHNHWWEFEPVDSFYPYQVWLERLDPTLFFELDVYWIKTAGLDPVEVLNEVKGRTPLLHIKDGPAIQKAPMVAAGQGVMDFPRIIEAGGDAVEWLIVELDECATDMMVAVEKSYHYLVDSELARGQKSN